MSKCHVVYAGEEAPETVTKSIFLAGPTPREDSVESWRPKAIELLEDTGYDGVVFVPEDRSGVFPGDWLAQVNWETTYLHMADCILFWVPRDIETMPAFTTNVEFGAWKDSGKVVFGAPKNAPKNRYLKHHASELALPSATSLKETVENAVTFLGSGSARTAGEREVPLYVWNTPHFQAWYENLLAAGNRLDHARVEWSFRVGPNKDYVFLWALHVDVYISAEDRNKTNEFVISRPDISTIVMYKRESNIYDSTVVLVREFRSPVSNNAGFVYENAGGSSFKPGGNPLQLAAEEVHEETGLSIAASRFIKHEVRQVAATLSAHRAHLFSVELTDEEIVTLRASAGKAFGVAEDSEQTYVEVMTLQDIHNQELVDWSMIGMIHEALQNS